MNNDKILNLIGLAMRSRKVTLGQDAVFAKLPNESLKMIFLLAFTLFVKFLSVSRLNNPDADNF